MKAKIRNITGEIASLSPWFEFNGNGNPREFGKSPRGVVGYKEVEILESSGNIIKLFSVSLTEIEIVS